jgi:hypothetical protein
MIKRYEAAYSVGPEPKTLIFLEGTFEALPFEVRLMEPWHGCRYIEEGRLKSAQRCEIIRQGYALVLEADVKLRNAA